MAADTSGQENISENEFESHVNSNIRQILSTRDFSLNIDRTLRRKINGCRQVQVEYECTGGGITGTMDTATFELFRSACTKFYSGLPSDEGSCEIDISQDKKKKAVVQQTYRFRHVVDTKTTGYTINLYSTNNRLLINGKDLDTLMERHLPILHEIMCQGVRDLEIEGVEQYNRILAEQMSIIWRQRRGESSEPSPQTGIPAHASTPQRQQTKEDSVKMNLSNLLNSPCTDVKQLYENGNITSRSVNQSCATNTSPEHAKCFKCKRNVRKNAAVCQIGNHWIHYRCDKLTDSEITRLHNDQGFIYNCKNCSTQETQCKTVRQSVSETIKLKIPECQPAEGNALNILKEESSPVCSICDTLINGNESVCGICTSVFHPKCMSETNEEMCLACAANELQLNEGTAKNNTLHSPSPTVQLPRITQKAESSIKLNQNGPEAPSNSAPTKKDVAMAQSNSQKQRELRQTELKLKKWEEELKIREAKCSETYQSVSRLEDYVRKVEARNLELQETVRTLHRKIDIQNISTENSNTKTFTENLTYNSSTMKPDPLMESNALILGVQDQVTSFIMRKVAKQIQQIEEMDEPAQDHTVNKIQTDSCEGVSPVKNGNNSSRQQQHAHVEPRAAYTNMATDQEQRREASMTSYRVLQTASPQVLPPHLIKSVPPPPYLQGQPLVTNWQLPIQPLLNRNNQWSPAVSSVNNCDYIPRVNSTAKGQSFLPQTMPRIQRM